MPSEIYAKYAFAEKLKISNRKLPKVHLVLKNRITQYMGAASAYHTVLTAIDNDISTLIQQHGNIFTFNNIEKGVIEIRDFQTTGVVAYARGCPFYKLTSGRLDLLGKRVQVKEDYRINCVDDIKKIISKLQK